MKEKTYCIYLHRNKINNKCYVGQTCQKPQDRWQNGNGYKEQSYFYRAIVKYGWNNFEHIILETNISESKVNEREIYWIKFYNSVVPNGYNLTFGGNAYHICSKESSKRRSDASKKRWLNPEYRKLKILQSKKAWEKQSFRDKCLKNLDRTGKGGAARRKKVICVETQQIFSSLHEAERITGVSHCNISQVCNHRGNRETAGGFHWEFYND